METNASIAVVGAGAWGLSAALALAEAGHSALTVLDQGRPMGGSTSLGAGLVSTHLRLSEDIQLVLETERRIEILVEGGRAADHVSAASAFHRVGGLTLTTPQDASRLENLQGRIRRAGSSAEFIRGEDLKRWPIRSARNLVGLFTSHDGFVVSADLFALVQARLRELGVRLVPETPTAPLLGDGACVGVSTPGKEERFDKVLVAAGAWSKRLLAKAGLPLPVKAYRTQLAAVEYEGGGRLPIVHDMDQRIYTRPDGDRQILVGDGTEFVEREPDSFDRAADRPFIEKVARSVSRRFEKGDEARFRKGWAGLCVGTPDRNPIIGPHPTAKNLFLMVGDNGFGVMRSLALGHVAARRVEGRMLPGAELYAPKRLDFSKDFPIREGFELD